MNPLWRDYVVSSVVFYCVLTYKIALWSSLPASRQEEFTSLSHSGTLHLVSLTPVAVAFVIIHQWRQNDQLYTLAQAALLMVFFDLIVFL